MFGLTATFKAIVSPTTAIFFPVNLISVTKSPAEINTVTSNSLVNNPDFVDDLINENNPNYIITPVDSIIDFKKFMDKNKLHYCNKPEIEKE